MHEICLKFDQIMINLDMQLFWWVAIWNWEIRKNVFKRKMYNWSVGFDIK